MKLSILGPEDGGRGQPAPAAADSLSPLGLTTFLSANFLSSGSQLLSPGLLLAGLGHELIMACAGL